MNVIIGIGTGLRDMNEKSFLAFVDEDNMPTLLSTAIVPLIILILHLLGVF